MVAVTGRTQTHTAREIFRLRFRVLHPQSEVGAQFYETLGLEGEIGLAIRKLKEWAAPRPVEKNLLTISDTVYIRPEPLGVVLIIGAWNYPWAVTIQPLVGAIAAGTAPSSRRKVRVQVCVCTKWTRSDERLHFAILTL